MSPYPAHMPISLRPPLPIPSWQTIRTALGDVTGRAVIHISANSYSSSLLPITRRCVEAAPEAAYLGDEVVPVERLDAIEIPAGAALLKIDTQGTESSVVRGADSVLDQVEAVEVEVSLVALYEGQDLAGRMQSSARQIPVALEPAFSDPASGEILQLDVLFARARDASLASPGSGLRSDLGDLGYWTLGPCGESRASLAPLVHPCL